MPRNGEASINYGDLTKGGRWFGTITVGERINGIVTLADGNTYRITTDKELLHIKLYSTPLPGMEPIDTTTADSPQS